MLKRLRSINKETAIIATVVVVVLIGCGAVLATHTSLDSVKNFFKSDTTAKVMPGATAPASVAACAVSDKLVNACRPWLGVTAHGYPQVAAKFQDQTLYHEKRIGRQVDFAKDYISPGELLSRQDTFFITRPSTYLFVSWKPATTWAAAAGGNASVNAQIDAMAYSIKAQAPHKVMLTVNESPEGDVSGTTPACGSNVYTGTVGTTADYRAMWTNIRKHFDAAGVNNVVWAMTYDTDKPSNCMRPDLWPGNNLVDWVMFDAFGNGDTGTFVKSIGDFYNYLAATSTVDHDYNSKPWGLSEVSSHLTSQASAATFWDDAKLALDNNTYPKLRAYLPFDSDSGKPDNRVDYWCDPTTVNQTATAALAVGACPKPVQDNNEQAHYKLFATDPRLTDAYYQKK